MRVHVTFEREKGGWYALLPAYPGPRDDLQMTLGADHWLYIMAQGASSVDLMLDTDAFDGGDVLSRKDFGWRGDREYDGATYWLDSYRGVPYGFDLWLCDATRFVFGELPELIYFSCVNTKP